MTKQSDRPGLMSLRARTLLMFLGAALLFSFPGPFSLPSAGAEQAQAQATAPAPEKPAQPKITLKGGPGDTTATAVVITGAPDSRAGIDAEYYYLGKIFGQRNVDWKLKRQSVLQEKGKMYDRMEIELKDGSKKTVFFDITGFFGKL